MKISIRYKLFLSHFFAILLVSGSIGSFFYTAAIENLTDSLRSRLQHSAAILANSFDGKNLDLIRTSEAAYLPAKESALAKLYDLVESNPDIAFIYVMSLSDNQVRFVLDSDTEEPAALGEIYEEYIPELIKGFKIASVDTGITTDKWGSFMSGYAPIKGGEVDYLVGIDMRADEVSDKLSQLKRQGLISLILSILFAYTCASFLSRSMLLRIKTLHERCLEHSPIKDKVHRHPGDELDGLSNAFDYLLDSVQATHEHLERQVNSRTKELEASNTKLSSEVDERRRMEKILKESASTDYLTGLSNRREMTNKLKSSSNFNESYSIALVDIDHFKEVNDQLGHDIGDEVLRKFARGLLHAASDKFEIARWGGEEFLIFMPETDIDQAQIEVERIRSTVKNMNFGDSKNLKVLTASFGIAEHKAPHKWETTVKEADIALYKAKENGRDCVMVNTEPSEA